MKFIQDDSYITYRYVRNILRGNGPVFNIGEYVEGYTNFFWMIILTFFGSLGASLDSIITLSQALGIFLGVCTLILVFFFSRKVFSSGSIVLAVLFLVANGAFVCWSTSGMETVLFSFMVTLSIFTYLIFKNFKWQYGVSSLCFGLASLVRPEAYFLWGMTFLHAVFIIQKGKNDTHNRLIKYLYLLLPYGIIVAPLFIWRYFYYGALLPNTFAAKTGFGMGYLATGFDSIWRFLKHYGFYGLGFILPLFSLRKKIIKLDSPYFYITYMLIIYCLYIIVLGGNVVQIHRFYVPMIPMFYLLLQEGILNIRSNRWVKTVIVVLLLFLTYWVPKNYIQHMRMLEIGLVSKMSATGRWLNRKMSSEECVAATTIGALSYYSDKELIDMLGLTDAYIPRHSEHLEGIRATWRERLYNTRYVLERSPLFIYFSTGIKPSAPAERALFLRERFRTGYYPYYFHLNKNPRGLETIYKRKPLAESIPLTIGKSMDPNFVNLYNEAINTLKRDKNKAISKFKETIEAGPKDFALPYEWIGRIYEMSQMLDSACYYYEEAVKIDDYCVVAHLNLGRLLINRDELKEAEMHFAKALKYDPDQFESYWWLSLVYEQLGEKRKALGLLERATEIVYGFSDFYLRLAKLYVTCGELRKAEGVLSAILKAEPDNTQAMELLRKILHQR
ncbi:tetratricopeptide repeat protein [candidate division WOR-3 bacterium]|nr:tetratricopeptide repeat protein [candidate division WOR-3 bacterium]